MRRDGAFDAADWGNLDVARLGAMDEAEPGGTAVVLLHGWGAPGDDLVPLAEALLRPRTRFFMPAGPLPEVGGGRAWWHLDPDDRPVHAYDDDAALGQQPNPQVLAARGAVQAVLRTIAHRYAPDVIALAGFSQGAMLSLDVALAAAPAVQRVAALSGLLLADALPNLRATPAPHPPVFLAHGRHDEVVPFAGGERARMLLEKYAYTVTWRPFAGGHEIPGEVVRALAGFLFGEAG